VGRRITDLGDPSFRRAFTGLRRGWFRLETRQHYAEPGEAGAFAAFLAGEPVTREPGAWQAMIRRHASSGRRLRRVHVVREPVSDYVRFEMAWAYPVNIAAGEQVRVIAVRGGEWPAAVPREDFWLLDDTELWAMRYDDTGRFLHAEHLDDRGAVAEHAAAARTAYAAAVSLAEYLPVSGARLGRAGQVRS